MVLTVVAVSVLSNPIQQEVEKIFGERVRELREARGLSLSQLSEMMTENGRPMAKGPLSKMERGIARSAPSSRDISAAAASLEVPPPALLATGELAELILAYAANGRAGVMEVVGRWVAG